MPKVHLVYPHRDRISCPDAIGRNLGKQLQTCYEVVFHDWDRPEIIRPMRDDILLGHANPSPFTSFRMSLDQPGWRRVILMTPYTHGDGRYNAFIDSFIERCDLYLTITGNYWFASVPQSIYTHWFPKMLHLDLAVDRKDFPVIKTHFNSPGQRRFVFIGKSGSIKNTNYLSQIARVLPDGQVGWMGSGHPIRGLNPEGYCDFSTLAGKDQIRKYDFLLMVSRADANPATILEAMAWGLIPICTPQSGYHNYPGIVNIGLDDPEGAAKILQRYQFAPEADLKAMQAANWQLLDSHFSWERFSGQVIEAIENNSRPELIPVDPLHHLFLRWQSMLAPYATWRRPRHLARTAIWVLGQLKDLHRKRELQ